MTTKFIKTTSAKLNEIEVVAGQVIFVEDERSIYLDSSSGRIAYTQIILLPNDSARIALTYPLTAFYFVLSTNILWRYDGTQWIMLTNPPTEEVIFLDSEILPVTGKENVLYVTHKCIYRYINGEFVVLGSGSQSWVDV